MLAANGPQDVPAICQGLNLSPSHVRHQLKALSRGGFVAIACTPALGTRPKYAVNARQVNMGLSELLVDFGVTPE
ncbi:ArsR family transcriptional regulator [Arthrobacter wenxiniae]|uniref:Helix-turn-helix transcriptional regulator n=1 Tax=Arthrobacter wenxiniae TaxID=2713570 RepID=A0A7Y7IIV9_9MICC|nr:ArsR family transcriptional regulator [Arthrobacter wenxiniae]NVM96133.1 helix-turn-helix transcriptional regulator [Arthrobacter wenxiniae]